MNCSIHHEKEISSYLQNITNYRILPYKELQNITNHRILAYKELQDSSILSMEVYNNIFSNLARVRLNTSSLFFFIIFIFFTLIEDEFDRWNIGMLDLAN